MTTEQEEEIRKWVRVVRNLEIEQSKLSQGWTDAGYLRYREDYEIIQTKIDYAKCNLDFAKKSKNPLI